MFAATKRLVLAIARVPDRPHAPFGSPDSMRVFRAADNYWKYLLVVWGVRQAFAAIVLGVVLTASGTRVAASYDATWWVHALELFGLGAFVLQLPLSLAAARLQFEMRWYIVTDRSLRIREGIFGVREMTLTFANVQNITIDQGPLQRLLGIADVVVRTAGGGAGSPSPEHGRTVGAQLHVGTLRAVDDAKGIRDLILDRLRHLRDAGLGDPDDRRAPALEAPSGDDSLERAVFALREAARDLAADARALRGLPGQPSA
jgi:membrane protein YdbS with pleckstrin-like domain